jgi:hypothetical protein
MHKTFRVITVLLFMSLSLTMNAQVFMLDGDENYRDPEDPGVFIALPSYGEGYDYYLPVGDGLVLLTALGGAYLLGKRRKENNK